MPYYTKLGLMPRKRHVQFRRPDGALYSEELFGTEGFVGPSSTMYHIHPPTQVYGWKPLYTTGVEYVEQEEQLFPRQKAAQAGCEWLPAVLGDTQRLCDGRDDVVRVVDRREVDEKHPICEAIAQLAGDMKQEACLSDATRSGEREQPDIVPYEQIRDRPTPIVAAE